MALTGWGYCRTDINLFKEESDRYTEAFIDEQVTLINAVKELPDVAVRLAEDEDAVQALSRDVAALRDRLSDLDAIDELASRQEYARAQERLASLPPTPALLRTKIYDMKRSLARSQGLDGGFLLRVDEGGEFLVLRGDSISIGNLRDGTSDITVLANIASHHARIQRRMTFHGGMEDRIRADREETRARLLSPPEAGRARRHPLRPRIARAHADPRRH